MKNAFILCAIYIFILKTSQQTNILLYNTSDYKPGKLDKAQQNLSTPKHTHLFKRGPHNITKLSTIQCFAGENFLMLKKQEKALVFFGFLRGRRNCSKEKMQVTHTVFNLCYFFVSFLHLK